MFPSLKTRTEDALATLQDRLEADAGSASEEEVAKAKQAVEDAKTVIAGK